ncbi:MAG: dihydrolipoyllysine-residue acetyltransferase [Thalassotalea sp.]|nr:dihydrolipoyllysine-residue acetyltransferase [Thalassotalea sp.]
MSIDFILPDIGEGIVECELVEWLVNEGDTIVEDQPVADVMTDKALVQIPAMHSGVIDKLYYAQGEIAKVHSPLFAMTPADSAPAQPTAVLEATPVVETTSVVAEVETKPASTVMGANIVEDFILPDIGEGIVECEIVDWLVSEGDIIEEDQAVVDVMTDKALVQIPAKYAGKVVKLHYAKGDIALVHQPLFAIEIANSGTAQTTPAAEDAVVASAVTAKVATAPVAAVANTNKVINAKALASPAVRRVARELDVNIHEVAGSGPKGRVFKQDVINFTAPVANTQAVQANNTAVAASATTRTEPIRGIKAAMAKAMVASVSTIPHFTYCEEIDMTNLIALRSQLKEVYAKQDIKLTMMPFFMKSMSLALKQFPLMNTKVNDDCTEITYYDDHNIGMAVDSKVGLLVPNVKNIESKSIVEVALEVARLTNDAREGRVASADIKGGTISISNIGALGGTIATPIINKPEVAIVALGKLQTLPRFDDNGNVVARSIMQVSWSGDHRVIDGGTIARFSNLWKSFLEEPSSMLMHMS